MSNLCIVLLSVACLFNSLAIVIHVWSDRPFRPRLGKCCPFPDRVKDLISVPRHEDFRDRDFILK